MAVVQLPNYTHKYTCLSMDTKPTDDVPNGSTCQETDTGLGYIWDGTAWRNRAPNLISGNIVNDPRGLVPISEPQIMTLETYDGSGQLVHPAAVYIPQAFRGYKFWLAATPYPNADNQYENPCIWASNDGVNFVVPTGMTNPLFTVEEGDTSNLADTHLEYYYDATTPANSYLALYWQHNMVGSDTATDYLQRATLGLTGDWSAAVKLSASDEVAAGNLGTSPSFVRPNYDSTNWVGFWPGTQPYRRDSSDGVNFGYGHRLNFGSIGRLWHSWFGVSPFGYEALLMIAPKNRHFRDSDLYYAVSANGWGWKVFPAPIIGRVGVDQRSIYRSCLVNFGDRKRVYFSVQNDDLTWRLWYQDFKVAHTQKDLYDNYCEIPIFRKLQVRDTAQHDAFAGNYSSGDPLNIMDWNFYKYKSLMYHTSHNVDLTLSFNSTLRGEVSGVPGAAAADALYRHNTGAVLATANLTLKLYTDLTAPIFVPSSDAPILGQILPGKVRISVKAASAPASGEMSMYLAMWN